ncbi:MAG: NfeD family protein [Actinomycetota bacterium]|nr:NfeD family protein [Actinomycetota bacterium]
MNDPSTWAFAWLVVAAIFGVGEMLTAGTFFMLPFALGGVVASIASFAGLPGPGSWVLFIVVSVVAFFALKPLARRLDLELPNPVGTGANRLVGSNGVVGESVPPRARGLGMVRIGGEEWRAETRGDHTISAGAAVRIVAIEGTRAIVELAADPLTHTSPDAPIQRGNHP